jgi:hypothetical protein
MVISVIQAMCGHQSSDLRRRFRICCGRAKREAVCCLGQHQERIGIPVYQRYLFSVLILSISQNSADNCAQGHANYPLKSAISWHGYADSSDKQDQENLLHFSELDSRFRGNDRPRKLSFQRRLESRIEHSFDRLDSCSLPSQGQAPQE